MNSITVCSLLRARRCSVDAQAVTVAFGVDVELHVSGSDVFMDALQRVITPDVLRRNQ